MNRCVVKMLNGNPVGIITRPDGAQRSLSGSDLIKYLGRIDERLIGRKLRNNPHIKSEGETLTYISKSKNKNIRIENKQETMEALYDLYIQDRQSYREVFDPIRDQEKKEKKVKRNVAAAGIIMIGGLALGKMAFTSGQHIDLETVATYDEEAIKEENTRELAILMEDNDVRVIDTTITQQPQNIEEDIVEQEITEDEIASIVGTPTHVNVDAVYDPGIENNIAYLEDIINERGNRWGVDPELLHDIISQESSGGKESNVGQFEFKWWDEQPMKVHNFETGRDVTVVFSNTPEQWNGKADIIITEADLQNIKTQVSTSAIILQFYFNMYDHNIPLAIQAYNRGQTNVDAMLRDTAQGEGVTVGDIKADQDNLSWIGYAYKDENGLTYFQEIVKHIDQEQQQDGINDQYEMAYIDQDGNVVIKTFQAQVNAKNK